MSFSDYMCVRITNVIGNRRHEGYLPRAALQHAGSSNGASSSYPSEYDNGYAYSDSGYFDNNMSSLGPALIGGLPKPSSIFSLQTHLPQ